MKKVLCLLALMLVAIGSPAARAETITVNGSTVFTTSIIEPNKDALEKETGLTLKVDESNAGKGLLDVAQGKADVAMIASPLEDVAAKINAKTPGAIDTASLKAFSVGKTGIGFMVNDKNPVKELKQEQIKDILKGKIKNWKEVGGEDLAINVITGTPETGLRTTVEKKLLGGESIAAEKHEINKTSMIIRVISRMPEALGILPGGLMEKNVRELKMDKTEEIPLFYVTKGEPSPPVKKLIDATVKLKGK
jgi:phosphate transport system substrate-binding protein